ncbi:hypothetical protein DL96DRAFT_1616569 [Flagelloscypha sp. PMI_526]|nr:hypothetical protein DL96DRAFT_1616569 [Flagelloscypha sp. PMI_526]
MASQRSSFSSKSFCDCNIWRTMWKKVWFCERFNLIGGSGTGGLLAVLLGPFQMTVQTARKVYLRIIQIAFGEMNGWQYTHPAVNNNEMGLSEPTELEPLFKEVETPMQNMSVPKHSNRIALD